MLDDLRNSSSFIDDDEMPDQEEEVIRQRPARRRSKETFLGMTAQQRFILSLMIFVMICALGMLALFVTGAIAVPGM